MYSRRLASAHMALLISSFLIVGSAMAQTGPGGPGRGPGGAPGAGPGAGPVVGPGAGPVVGPGVGPGAGPGRFQLPRNLAEATDAITRANSALLQSYGNQGRTSQLSVLGTMYRGELQPSRELQAVKDAKDMFRGYIDHVRRSRATQFSDGYLTFQEQQALDAFNRWDEAGRSWANSIMNNDRPDVMRGHLIDMLDRQELLRKANAGTQLSRADQFEIGDRWGVHVDRPQWAAHDRDFSWGRQAPLEHAMSRLSDETYNYLGAGAAFLSFTTDVDKAERQLDSVLRDYAAARPNSRRPQQLQDLLDQRARSMSSFRATWQTFPRHPSDNNRAREHLINALTAHERIATLTGASSFDERTPNGNTRAREIAGTFGVYLPAGSASFSEAQSSVGPGGAPGVGPGGAPGVGPGASPSVGPGAGPGRGPGAGPGRGPGAGPGSNPGSGPGAGPGRGPGTGAPGTGAPGSILDNDDIRNTDTTRGPPGGRGPGGAP